MRVKIRLARGDMCSIAYYSVSYTLCLGQESVELVQSYSDLKTVCAFCEIDPFMF